MNQWDALYGLLLKLTKARAWSDSITGIGTYYGDEHNIDDPGIGNHDDDLHKVHRPAAELSRAGLDFNAIGWHFKLSRGLAYRTAIQYRWRAIGTKRWSDWQETVRLYDVGRGAGDGKRLLDVFYTVAEADGWRGKGVVEMQIKVFLPPLIGAQRR